MRYLSGLVKNIQNIFNATVAPTTSFARSIKPTLFKNNFVFRMYAVGSGTLFGTMMLVTYIYFKLHSYDL